MPIEQLIFTDCPRGKGYNAANAGYQIKACSEGLSLEARDTLSSICMHYGDAVYRSAPHTSIDREMAWRAKADNVQVVPDEVLREFPVIWSYDRLADEVYALTQVRYTGLTSDGRPGNFLARALVFAPGDLARHNWNPFTLARSERFRPSPITDDVTLPSLPDLGLSADLVASDQVLRQGVGRDQIAVLLSALCDRSLAARPIVICLADWEQAAPLVEVLLNALPPTIRCRTTVCTFESDRSWLVAVKGVRPTGAVAAHQLLVQCTSDDRALNLRADEYRNRYVIFNFVGSQFSDVGEARPFAKFAATCLLDRNTPSLTHLHDLIDQFNVGQDSKAWDALTPAAALYEPHPQPAILAEALHALAAWATQPDQINTTLRLALPHIQALAQADDYAGLSTLKTDLAALLDKAPDTLDSTSTLHTPSRLAETAFANGQMRTTAALLQACGVQRERSLLQLLKDTLSKSPATIISPAPEAEREQLVSLLLEGLRLATQDPDNALPLPRLLIVTFQAAQEANQTAAIWEALRSIVEQQLGGEWNADKENLAQRLLDRTPATSAPEANIWLNLKLLSQTKLKGEQLRIRLTEAIMAAARCTDAGKHVTDLTRLAQEQITDPETLAVTLGSMANAAHGTASSSRMFESYQAALKQVDKGRAMIVYRRLAGIGAAHTLARELQADLVPWDETSPDKLNRWRDQVLSSHEKTFDDVRLEVASWLDRVEQTAQVLPLAEALITRSDSKAQTSPGWQMLFTAVVRATPLVPVTWRPAFAVPPTDLAPQVAARLRILKFLREIEQQAGSPKWNIGNFPADDITWRRDVHDLAPQDKRAVLGWCVDSFSTSGITTTSEARELIRLTQAVDEVDFAPAAVLRLLHGRDAVTAVICLTAFVDCSLEEARAQTFWGLIVRSVLERCDKSSQQLLEDHLAHRFGVRGEKAEERLREVCDAAGLTLPKATAEKAEKGANSAAAAPPVAAISAGVTDLMSSARRVMQGLIGGTKPADRSADQHDTPAPKPKKGKQ